MLRPSVPRFLSSLTWLSSHRPVLQQAHLPMIPEQRSRAWGPILLASAATALVIQRPLTTTTCLSAEGPQQRSSAEGEELIPQNQLKPIDVHYSETSVLQAVDAVREANSKTIPPVLEQCCSKDGSSVTLTLIGYKGGDLSTQINQDRAIVCKPFLKDPSILLGVFDGHAPLGEHVSEYAAQHLPPLLAQRLGDCHTEPEIKKAIDQVFCQLDREVPAEQSGGCTASIILLHNHQIYVANAGDSTSWIVTYRPKTKTVNIVYESRDDKPSLPEERKRVEQMGGQVYIPLVGTSRVVYHDAATGVPTGLAMSRSLGDWQAGQLGVIPNPIIQRLSVDNIVKEAQSDDDSGEDDVYVFAVSATDGLMDFLDIQDVSRVVADSLCREDTPHILVAAERLVYAGANAWQASKQGRYRDDISIAISLLRSPPTK